MTVLARALSSGSQKDRSQSALKQAGELARSRHATRSHNRAQPRHNLILPRERGAG